MTPANKKLVLQKGVTFIELTIVIAIFSIIAGSILFNFSRFGRTVTIQNLAQDIALQINSAQKDAISGRTNELIFSCDRTANDCAPTYGLYFVPINGDTAKIAGYSGDAGVNFLRFIDRPDTTGQFDGMLEAGGNACGDLSSNNTECLDLLSLGRGNTVVSPAGI
jgi:prepilin-type N-terminal cleavage/methylation domain-containing protein